MDTLKYSYGATPEDVIREQWGAIEMPQVWYLGFDVDADSLVTVLDALHTFSYNAAGGFVVGSAANGIRSDILAALGIEES